MAPRRPLPMPAASSVPPVRGPLAQETQRLEAKLKEVVRTFMTDTMGERVESLIDRNQELEEELKFLRAKLKSQPGGGGGAGGGGAGVGGGGGGGGGLASHPPRPSPATTVRRDLLALKATLDDVQKKKNAGEITAAQAETRVAQVNQRRLALLQTAKKQLDLEQRNVRDLEIHMRKQIETIRGGGGGGGGSPVTSSGGGSVPHADEHYSATRNFFERRASAVGGGT